MSRFGSILIFLCFLSNGLLAQSPQDPVQVVKTNAASRTKLPQKIKIKNYPVRYDQKFGVEAAAGLRIGMWIYNKGFADSTGTHRGYDRTHSTPLIPIELNFYYRIWRFKIGVGASYHLLTDQIMIGSDSRRGNVKAYPISLKPNIQMIAVSALIEYDLVQRTWFSVAPHLKLGTFWSDHIHPEKEDLGFNFAAEIGVTTEFRMGQLGFFLRPTYNNYRLFYKGANPGKKGHSIYGFGLTTGLRIWAFY